MMFFQGIADVIFGVGAEVDAVTAFCRWLSVARTGAIDGDDDSVALV